MTRQDNRRGSPLTTGEVARALNVSVDRVRQLARSGQLTFTETPYGRLFDPVEVEAFRERHQRRHDETTG